MRDTLETLIETICHSFHATHRSDLERMEDLARQLSLDGLANEIDELRELLEAHMRKEEEQLFPRMTDGSPRELLQKLVDDLQAEHRQIDATARSVAASVIMLAPVLDTGRQKHAVEFLDTCRRFFAQLAEHASIEDEDVFPLARRRRKAGAGH